MKIHVGQSEALKYYFWARHNLTSNTGETAHATNTLTSRKLIFFCPHVNIKTESVRLCSHLMWFVRLKRNFAAGVLSVWFHPNKHQASTSITGLKIQLILLQNEHNLKSPMWEWPYAHVFCCVFWSNVEMSMRMQSEPELYTSKPK